MSTPPHNRTPMEASSWARHSAGFWVWIFLLGRTLLGGQQVLGPLHPRDPDGEWEIPVWTTTVTVRSSGGWRDNALLSGTNAQETPFAG